MKRALKKNPELQKILDEVSGKPSSKGENVRAEFKTVSPRPSKRKATFTPTARQLFKNAIKKDEDLEAKIDALEEQFKSNRKVLQKLTERFGVRLVSDPRDLVLYAHPNKTHLVWSDRGGSVDADKVAKAFPELIDDANKTVNLSLLKKTLEDFEVPASMVEFFRKFEKLVSQLEKSTGVELVEKSGEGLLNFDKYAEYKRIGKVTSEQAAQFESSDGSYSLRIDKLSDRARCSACGFPRAKRSIGVQAKHACTRCGHSE